MQLVDKVHLPPLRLRVGEGFLVAEQHFMRVGLVVVVVMVFLQVVVVVAAAQVVILEMGVMLELLVVAAVVRAVVRVVGVGALVFWDKDAVVPL